MDGHKHLTKYVVSRRGFLAGAAFAGALFLLLFLTAGFFGALTALCSVFFAVVLFFFINIPP